MSELLKLNETTDDQLVIIREFKAPIELVFKALTVADYVSKWHCPPSMTVAESEIDLKVGGTYKIVMVHPKGMKYTLLGTYRVIESPTKLVYTQLSEMADGNRSPDTEIIINLEETSGVTQMIFHQKGFATKQDRDNANMGWPAAFDKLGTLVDELTQN